MRKLSLILLLALSSPVVAQEGQPPAVTVEAPALSGAAVSETPAVPPSLPAASDEGVPEGTVPASPAPSATPGSVAGSTSAAEPSSPAADPVQPLAPAAPPNGHEAVAPVLPQNDLFEIVLSAHWVVQTVMAILAVAAFAVLVILIHKLIEYALAFGALSRTARGLASATTLAEAEAATRDHKGPAADMIRAATEELTLAAADPVLLPGVRERTSAALARIDAGAAQRLRAGTGLLASIGSLSPFIGLFGTVFGIMNSFLAIAESKTTNLAVVAPGIAEALFATAVGLAAAIPAVLVYNICGRLLAKYRNRIGDVAAAAQRLQSRDLDRLAAKG